MNAFFEFLLVESVLRKDFRPGSCAIVASRLPVRPLRLLRLFLVLLPKLFFLESTEAFLGGLVGRSSSEKVGGGGGRPSESELTS